MKKKYLFRGNAQINWGDTSLIPGHTYDLDPSDSYVKTLIGNNLLVEELEVSKPFLKPEKKQYNQVENKENDSTTLEQ